MILEKDGKPLFNFLNSVLDLFEFENITFFSTIFFSAFSLYMLWCTLKGLIKFGLRLFIVFPIHPMKVNGTWMNSFIFNIWLLLLTSVAVVHFCSEAFQGYIRLSTINKIFGVYLKRIKYVEYLFKYNVFVIGLIVRKFATLTFYNDALDPLS